MVFVRAHDREDFVAVKGPIAGGDAGPETSNFQNHFRPAEGQKFPVAGDLIILPHIVGNSGIHMPLQASVVGSPASRLGVEVKCLTFLTAVTAALPGIHRTPVPRLFGIPASLIEPAVAVPQEGTSDIGNAKVQDRKGEQLVPEDVPAIGLAVEAAGRDANIQIDTGRGNALQEVKQMKAQDILGRVVVLDGDVASLPEALPPLGVAIQQLVKAASKADRLSRLKPAFGDASIARRIECCDLLNCEGVCLFHVNGTLMSDEARFLGEMSLDLDGFRRGKEFGSGSLRYLKAGLVGLDLQVNALLTHRRGFQKVKVLVVKRLVAFDAGIDDASVET